MANFLETLKDRIVVFDGARGTNLQVQNLTLDDFGGLLFEGCNENLLVTRPDAVEKVHVGFLEVGCDVIETNSFNGTAVDFSEYGIGDQAYDMNVRAARLAKELPRTSQPKKSLGGLLARWDQAENCQPSDTSPFLISKQPIANRFVV